MSQFAVSAVGRDRPGIVAAIAEALLELDGNVEDSRMTILRGHFVVMLIVTLPGDDQEALRQRLAPVREQLGLDALTVSEVGEAREDRAHPSHVITVYGADRPGIVRAVSAALAAAEVNITDLQTQLAGSEDAPLYVMMLEVELGGSSPAEVEALLADVAERSAVDVSLTELETEAI